WIVARAVDGAAVVIVHLPAGLRPGRLGRLRVPAIERKPNVNRPSRSRHVATRRKLKQRQPPAKGSRPPITGDCSAPAAVPTWRTGLPDLVEVVAVSRQWRCSSRP